MLGADHPNTLSLAYTLTVVLNELGKDQQAWRLGEDTLTRHRRVLGAVHPDILGSAHNLFYDITKLGEDQRARRASRLIRWGTSALSSNTQRAPDWRATQARFDKLRSQYSQFECDPLAVLRLPALTDVTVASTARFVDAFAEAQALDTDAEPPTAHSARFATAVDQAWHAWHAARDAAQRIRLARIPANERATVQRAIKLLTMARESDHDAERTAAYTLARAELAKLERSGTLTLPPAAATALDAAARSQLPPGPTTD